MRFPRALLHPRRTLEALTTPLVPALQLPPDPYTGDGTFSHRTPGYFICSTVAELCKRAIAKLEAIPNAQRADIDIFVESAWGAYRLGQALARVDSELIARSNDALAGTLDEWTPWNWHRHQLLSGVRGRRSRPRIFTYRPQDAERNHRLPRKWKPGTPAPHVLRADKEARAWVDSHLSDTDRRDFLALIDRRLELRQAAQSALDEFRATCTEIDETSEKAQAIASAQQLNRELVLSGQTEYELGNVQAGHEAVAAISAGLDTAWPTTAPARQLNPGR